MDPAHNRNGRTDNKLNRQDNVNRSDIENVYLYI